MTKTKADGSKSKPYVANYPPLRDWLRKHDARCMWQVRADGKGLETYDDPPRAFVECYMVRMRLFIVVIHADQHGWEIYTPGTSPRVDETLAEAEKRLGLAE